MLELLTEKNLAMGEVGLLRFQLASAPADADRLYHWQRLEQQRITIEELEALCELNDELVENHLENEKELKEEIGTTCSSALRLSPRCPPLITCFDHSLL